jgi:hypothetical protein
MPLNEIPARITEGIHTSAMVAAAANAGGDLDGTIHGVPPMSVVVTAHSRRACTPNHDARRVRRLHWRALPCPLLPS